MSAKLGQREVGKRFRRAVAHDLKRSGEVAVTRRVDWIVFNGVQIALRYSKCHIDDGRSVWFYGVLKPDSKRLASRGALLLIVPHSDGHRFVLFSESETKHLLSRCKGSKRGDLKIHVHYEHALGTFRVQEWPEFELGARACSLTDEAMSEAELQRGIGLSVAATGTETVDGPVGAPQRSTRRRKRASQALQRTPRAFDPTYTPVFTMRAPPLREQEEALVRREQAHQAHQRLVTRLDEYLRATGWSNVEELPGAIDLWGRRPSDRGRVIFECKSMEAPEDELARCRSGLAQLFEYRFEYGEPADSLCLVTDGPVSSRRVRFLESLGIGCLSLREGVIDFLGGLAKMVVGSEP